MRSGQAIWAIRSTIRTIDGFATSQDISFHPTVPFAGVERIELSLAVLETVVLPLHQTPVILSHEKYVSKFSCNNR